MKNLSLLIAFAGGAVTGAVIGLMLAPDKGEVTRHKIADKAMGSADKAKMKLKKFLENHGVKMNCSHIDEIVDDIIPDIKEKFED